MSKVKRDILFTMLSRAALLILNFLLVLATTRLWGAEGRGLIALFATDLGLISIFTSVFSGSSTSFNLRKFLPADLFLPVFLWAFILSFFGAVSFHILGRTDYSLFLFVSSTLLGCITFFNSLFVGKQSINRYNLVVVLQPLLMILFLMIFYLFDSSYFSYFYAQCTSLMVLLSLCFFMNDTPLLISKNSYKEVTISLLKFGVQTELSNFLQFFNYRLSYYFLGYYSGLAAVGIFSIGVSLSEIVWKLSGSISTVQYSQLLSQNKNHEARRVTTKMAWLCCGVTLLFLLIAFMIPAPIYGWVFGDEFAEAKSILMFLSPGVLAVAISNVWGHYFSAFGELKILILKSFSGVVVAFVLSLVLVPVLGVEGACWVNLMANLVCSLVLGVAYFFDKKQVAK